MKILVIEQSGEDYACLKDQLTEIFMDFEPQFHQTMNMDNIDRGSSLAEVRHKIEEQIPPNLVIVSDHIGKKPVRTIIEAITGLPECKHVVIIYLSHRPESAETEEADLLMTGVLEYIINPHSRPLVTKARIKNLKLSRLNPQQDAMLELIESNINRIALPHTRTLSTHYLDLTPTEIQVADMIQEGKSTKEIAMLLNVCAGTIVAHRNKIRGKIGIKNKKVNLQSYLRSLG